MLDAKKLENYLIFQAINGNFSLIPKNADNARVLGMTRLSGGMSNNVYSFSLQFNELGSNKTIDLVLKGYTNNTRLWYENCPQVEETRPYFREFQAQKALALSGFPVPKVFFCESDSKYLGYPFVIMEKEISGSGEKRISSFADTLANLHNLEVRDLGIDSLTFPVDNLAFAKDRLSCLKKYLVETKHLRSTKKDFEKAITWLESNLEENCCPKYCLLHGEYHLNHTVLTKDGILKVIDWENVQIGDPAFDVGYAYHSVKLMNSYQSVKTGDDEASNFLVEYAKQFNGNVTERLEFYKMVGLLGVAIVVSSLISNPMMTYKRFGKKAFARALMFPYFRSHASTKRWLNDDFLIYYLNYCRDYIQGTI